MIWYLFLIGIGFFLFCYIYGIQRNSLPLMLISGIILIVMAILLFSTGLDIPTGWAIL